MGQTFLQISALKQAYDTLLDVEAHIEEKNLRCKARKETWEVERQNENTLYWRNWGKEDTNKVLLCREYKEKIDFKWADVIRITWNPGKYSFKLQI